MSTHESLCAVLRELDTTRMTTQAVAEACLVAVPEAEIDDVIAAATKTVDLDLRFSTAS